MIPSTMSLRTAIQFLLLLISAAFITAQSIATQPQPCIVESQPNPIAKQYPDLPTGTLNMTLLIIPIPLTTARKLVPAKWPILEHAYRALIPSLARNSYPVLVQGGIDHDIGLEALDIHLPDFSVSSPSSPSSSSLLDSVSLTPRGVV